MPSCCLLPFNSDVICALIGCLNGKYSGFTVDGTFSQYVVSWVTHVTPIPENLDSAEAASILCAVSHVDSVRIPGGQSYLHATITGCHCLPRDQVLEGEDR